RTITHFIQKLNEIIDITIDQLLDRYEFQIRKHARNFPFLYGQKIWKDSEDIQADDTLETVLKHGTLSVGFIGLAEALVALTGEHHGESKEAYTLGYQIVQMMRERMEEATERYQLNFTLIATPAEGLSGRFTKYDQEKFGVIQGVTDRKFYTNSFHIPVYYPIKAIDKIRKEGPFHKLCNAGHISYIECDGDVTKNIQALDRLVKAMAEADMGYGSINHPVDRCKACGYTGIIDTDCPTCGNDSEQLIERIRRITGYLVGEMSKWNSAKTSEESERVKHQ